MTQLSHFDRVKALTVKTIDNCEKRLGLLLKLPDPETGQYLTPLAPFMQESISKLKEHAAKSITVRTDAAKITYVETSLDLLSDLANRIDAFDVALKRTKWGRTELSKIKKSITQ